MPSPLRLLVVALVVPIAAITMAADRSRLASAPPVEEIASPAGDGARFPAFARTADGGTLMVWGERLADSSPVIKASVRAKNGSWGPVRTVMSRDTSLLLNFADHPHGAALSNGDLVVSWLRRGPMRGYGVRMSRSTDGGATWSAPVSPHDTAARGEHGFVSFVPMPGGRVAFSFLDGTLGGSAGGATHVEWATFDGATRLTSRTIDDRACDCCATASAATSEGPIVVYRDRSSDEIRDMAITRLVKGSWTKPVHVADDNWKIAACPLNGPAVAAAGKRVFVAWFTAPGDSGQVKAAWSDDAGKTFSPAFRVDDGRGAGHVDVAFGADGTAWVSWLERGEGERFEVRARRVRRDGTRLSAVTLATVTGFRPSGWPALTVASDGLLAAWTVPGSAAGVGKLRLARIAPDASR
jgi:hypothetical protein